MDFPFTITTDSARETKEFGYSIGQSLPTMKERALVLCCWGDLGSGKTTFVQGFAEGLGITGRLLSPTYIIVRRYKFPIVPGYLYHADFYRIHSQDEIDAFGITEMLTESDSVVVIEWPERLGAVLPNDRFDIRFRALPDGTHMISGEHIRP